MMNIPRVTSFRGSDMMRIAAVTEQEKLHSRGHFRSWVSQLNGWFVNHPTFPKSLDGKTIHSK